MHELVVWLVLMGMLGLGIFIGRKTVRPTTVGTLHFDIRDDHTYELYLSLNDANVEKLMRQHYVIMDVARSHK